MRFQNTILCLAFFICFSQSTYAEFEIKLPCETDDEISQNTGKKHKFYASLLAFNSEQPRCLKNIPIITLQHVDEAIISNDQQTNDVIIDIILTDEGKNIFALYSKNNKDSEVALMIENKILAMLSILEPIVDGRIQIRGLWYEDAVRLSNSINVK